MTITQTVEIPADRRIILEVPPEQPVGTARVSFTLTPLSAAKPAKDEGKIRLTKQQIDEMLNDETLRFLTGLLHTEVSAEEIRAERLSKL